MTVLMREELNDADLAWAAADHAVASVMGQLLRARQELDIRNAARPRPTPRPVADPALLRARGAL